VAADVGEANDIARRPPITANYADRSCLWENKFSNAISTRHGSADINRHVTVSQREKKQALALSGCPAFSGEPEW